MVQYSAEQVTEYMDKLRYMYGFDTMHAAQLVSVARSWGVNDDGTEAILEIVADFAEQKKIDMGKVFECQRKLIELAQRSA